MSLKLRSICIEKESPVMHLSFMSFSAYINLPLHAIRPIINTV